MEQIKTFLNEHKNLTPILKKIIQEAGIPYLVGGSVRDMVLNIPVKDIDIEVHEMPLGALEECLKQFGHVRLVGKQFGVLLIDGINVDWSLPRKDSSGRKPQVELDPHMGIKEASRRRDLTLNAMSVNLKNALDGKYEFEDPYGGYKDIENKILRAVDEKLFVEDPLRFYRVMQFIARFEMNPDEQLIKICKKIDLHGVARERIYEELIKMFLKSKSPSLGFRFLKDIDRLKELFPELYALIGVKQPEEHHPEGDVFEHSMQALDAAARLDMYKSDAEKLLIMFAALCHDFGKPGTTDEDLHAYDHDKAGVPLAQKFLKRITDDAYLHSGVKKLVRYHLMPVQLMEQQSKINAYKRLAKKLAPEVSLRQLSMVALCDARGTNPDSSEPLEKHQEVFDDFMKIFEEASIEHGPEKSILLGRHLLDYVEPGEELGKLVDEAYEIQIEEGIKDLEELKRRVLKDKKIK